MVKTKFVCMSDLHGWLPQTLPKGDVLLLGGDIGPIWDHSVEYHRNWYKTEFAPWLKQFKFGQVFAVAGNHDFYLAQTTNPNITIIAGDIAVLQDCYVPVGSCCGPLPTTDLQIWGSPWQTPFGVDWCFNLPEDKAPEVYDKIPEGIDIILSHGPPYGYGDKAPRYGFNTIRGYENTGSKYLLKTIERVKPKLVVCGHLHESRGIYDFNGIPIINASVLDGNYNPYECDPFVVEI